MAARSSTPRKTFLELGATDAVTIGAGTAMGLDMEDPDTSVFNPITVTGSANNFNSLQGSLGLVSVIPYQ